MIRDNLARLKEAVGDACRRSGRDPSAVKIMAVTKTVDENVIREAYDSGITLFGESRVQDARRKSEAGAFQGARVCLVGHLQTNKASVSARIFDEVHSVDSVRVAKGLSKASLMYRAQDNPLGVLLQVNTGGDPSKFGFSPDEVLEAARAVLGLGGLNLKGLMTVAPGPGLSELARDCFRQLRQLKERLEEEGIPAANLTELSMGMTADFPAAIEEGATMIRIGTALFR